MAVAARPRMSGGLALAGLLVFSAASGVAETVLLGEERARRAEAATTAYNELEQGDEAYERGEFSGAMKLYAAARGKLSGGEATAELREAATVRYAQAAVAHGQKLQRMGRADEAIKLMQEILSPAVMPDYAPAETLLTQLRDPLRTNPVLTPEHVRDVEEVRKNLYRADGYLSLGDFDGAGRAYEQVLRVDPTNTAARRGLATVNRQKSDYYRAAADEARSRLLGRVDAAWEQTLPPEPGLEDVQPVEQIERAGANLLQKLNAIVIENVALDQVGLREAVDYLRQLAKDLDTLALNEADRGVDFVLDLGNDPEVLRRIESIRFDLTLRGVPLSRLLKYITDATGTEATAEQFAIVIRPEGSVSDRILTRKFRVPPDFLSREAVSKQVQEEDPFGVDDSPAPGLLGKKMTAQDFFEEQGVGFPQGASAIYQPSSSTLTVRNTAASLDYIEQIVESINNAEPVVVIVEATFINVREDLMNELGYDWLLSPLGGNYFLGGGSVGTGQAVNDFGLNPVGGTQRPVTAGLRSGARTEGPNSIDDAINRPPGSVGGAVTSGQIDDLRAPGIVAVNAIFDDAAVSVMLRGIANAGGDDTMIRKSVVTRSGQTASVEATRRFIYPTEYEPPQIPDTVTGTTAVDLLTGESATAISVIATPATPTAFDVKKVGCELEVEPLVGPDKRYIELAVRPTITEFDGFIDYGTPIYGGSSSIDFGAFFGGLDGFAGPSNFGEITANNILQPIFSTTRANTNLILLDGSTVVMGGLLQSKTQIIEDKVPILGDLPLVGRFFKSEAEAREEQALIILIKARLVDPSGQPFRDN